MLLRLANLVSKISSFSLHCFSASLHRFFSFSKSSVAVASKSSNFFVLSSSAAREDYFLYTSRYCLIFLL